MKRALWNSWRQNFRQSCSDKYLVHKFQQRRSIRVTSLAFRKWISALRVRLAVHSLNALADRFWNNKLTRRAFRRWDVQRHMKQKKQQVYLKVRHHILKALQMNLFRRWREFDRQHVRKDGKELTF